MREGGEGTGDTWRTAKGMRKETTKSGAVLMRLLPRNNGCGVPDPELISICMVHAWAIRRFLFERHGYYCETGLAQALGLPVHEIRRNARRRETTEVVTRYRICHGCMAEKEVVGLRICA